MVLVCNLLFVIYCLQIVVGDIMLQMLLVILLLRCCTMFILVSTCYPSLWLMAVDTLNPTAPESSASQSSRTDALFRRCWFLNCYGLVQAEPVAVYLELAEAERAP